MLRYKPQIDLKMLKICESVNNKIPNIKTPKPPPIYINRVSKLRTLLNDIIKDEY